MIAERIVNAFFSRIASAPSWSACWAWGGAPTTRGYGRFTAGWITGETGLAHRRAYEMAVGPIPAGLVIDHLCENTLCVNPLHLQATTQRHNTLRSGRSAGAKNAAKTACPAGHEFTPENTYVRPNGGRCCRLCRTRQKAAARQRTTSTQ